MRSLTKSEEQVMQVLWRLQKGQLKDIVEDFPEPRPHSNTVATMLKILIDKGFVRTEQQGRNNLYHAAVSKGEYSGRSATQLLEGYFDGSAAKLVSHFISDSKLSIAELEALLQQIRSSKSNQS